MNFPIQRNLQRTLLPLTASLLLAACALTRVEPPPPVAAPTAEAGV